MQRPHMVQTVVGGKQDNIKPAVQKLSAYSRLCWKHFCIYMHSNTFPFALSFQEQYDFCYRVVQDFVDIFSDYANFK